MLDLDGVLLTRAKEADDRLAKNSRVNPLAMALFNQLARRAEAEKSVTVRAVLTSARRYDRGIRQLLQKGGLEVKFHHHWRTARDGGSRGQLVQDWLKAHPQVRDYLIFDDFDDFLPSQKRRLVKCREDGGLKRRNYKRACHLLGMAS